MAPQVLHRRPVRHAESADIRRRARRAHRLGHRHHALRLHPPVDDVPLPAGARHLSRLRLQAQRSVRERRGAPQRAQGGLHLDNARATLARVVHQHALADGDGADEAAHERALPRDPPVRDVGQATERPALHQSAHDSGRHLLQGGVVAPRRPPSAHAPRPAQLGRRAASAHAQAARQDQRLLLRPRQSRPRPPKEVRRVRTHVQKRDLLA